jgi:hypothetical protein
VLTDGNIVNAKPNFYDGALAAQLDQRIQKDLGEYIVPAKATYPILPNFFAELISSEDSPAVVKRQVCYDGALGARAMHRLQCFREELIYDGNAYTITASYQDGVLSLYTTHPMLSTNPKTDTDYVMTQLGSYSLTHDAEVFQQGVSALRNARDWAKEQRDRFIAVANSRVVDM